MSRPSFGSEAAKGRPGRRRATRFWVLLALILGLAACGDSSAPTTPSADALPPLDGVYALRIQASAACTNLSLAIFGKDVQARRFVFGSRRGFVFSDVGFTGAIGRLEEIAVSGSMLEGRLEISPQGVTLPPAVADPGSFSSIHGLFQARGTLAPGPGGRAEIRTGTLAGELGLSWTFEGRREKADCSVADHAWSLTAR